MINLNSQRREFAIVISDITRCDYTFNDFVRWLNNSGFRYYYIVHDKDVNDNGEPTLVHIHLVLTGLKRWRVKQLLNDLADSLWTNVENIQIDEVKNLTASVQYLIHKNDTSKYQYDASSIKTNDLVNLTPMLLETIQTCSVTTQRLSDMILKEDLSRLELIHAIGIGSYQHFRSVINDLYEIKLSLDGVKINSKH